MFTLEHFKKLKIVNPTLYLDWFNKYCVQFNINTYSRLMCFLPNLLHESGNFRYVEELATGDAYDTRVDLGNTPQIDGDGRLYKGRGLAQITGKKNYRLFTIWCNQNGINIDFVKTPLRLKEPQYAVLSAFWYWQSANLQFYADKKDFLNVCSIWNTGKIQNLNRPHKINGWNDRVDKYKLVAKVLQA